MHVTVVEPGPVAGEFVENSGGAGGPPADGPYALARVRFQAVQDSGYEMAQSAHEIACLLWDVATVASPHLRYQTSNAITRLAGIKVKDLTGERVVGLTRTWIE